MVQFIVSSVWVIKLSWLIYKKLNSCVMQILKQLNKNLFFICAGLSVNLLYAGEADLRPMEKYLNEGGDPNQRALYVKKYGLHHTALPLHKAAEWGDKKLVELALEKR